MYDTCDTLSPFQPRKRSSKGCASSLGAGREGREAWWGCSGAERGVLDVLPETDKVSAMMQAERHSAAVGAFGCLQGAHSGRVGGYPQRASWRGNNTPRARHT